MKKRAISLVLCLVMVVTLLGNGIPIYAENELEPPIVATDTEESATVNSPETTEEAVAEEKPDVATPPHSLRQIMA